VNGRSAAMNIGCGTTESAKIRLTDPVIGDTALGVGQMERGSACGDGFGADASS
jgi:hypothetical protein